MKRRMWLAGILMALLSAAPAKADTGIIIRTTGGLSALQLFCSLPGSPCTIIGGPLDGTLGQVFLVTTPLNATTFISLLGQPVGGLTGFVDAEVNQLLSLVDLTSLVPSPIPTQLIPDRSSTFYPAGSSTPAWNSYVNQPAASIVEVQNAQKSFNVMGTGIVADIDTGVDPTHPALQGVLLQGYDFTRNQPGGSELNDVSSPCPFATCPPPPCPSCSPAKVNQSTAAVLDQSTAAVLDGSPYAAFGHGTMVMGIIHLVAPTAMLMPLKAFHSDGTASLSDILRAIYYGVQNSANVINMSFDTKTSSVELQKALDYANSKSVICAASAGNDGQGPPLLVYPAALQSDVMGVASTTNQDTRSSFSNYGNAIVWVAAPGEAIVSTYPFDTYAAGWGTSFSAPFVSGGAALLHNLQTTIAQSGAASATSHAVPLTDPGMGNGRLDLCMAIGSVGTGSCSPDYAVSAKPTTQTITAGQQASFTVSATPQNGSKQTVTWSCMVAPAGPNCTVSPQSVTLDGTNTASATATLMTVARGLATPMAVPRGAPLSDLWVTLAVFFAGLSVLLMLCGLMSPPRRRPGLAAAAGLLAVLLYTYSCGGYGNSPGPGPGPGSPTLSSVTLNPMSVTGGSQSSTGTVTLSGPAPNSGVSVNLSSSASAATVPASVTVAYGASSATFTVTTSAVSASTPVTITASFGGVTQTATLTVMPAQAAPTLSSVTLNPTSVTGGAQSSTGTVTLSGSAPSGGAQVMLSSDNGAASVPASVTVAAGASTATFMVNTSAVTASAPVTISASYAGVTKTASLTVVPPGTPAGTYTLTITGTSGNLSHSTTVQVVVN
jgi:subtilisin family serine protease